METHSALSKFVRDPVRVLLRWVRRRRRRVQKLVADGLLGVSDRLFMGVYQRLAFLPASIVHGGAHWIGDIGALVRDILGPRVWQLNGPQWSIVYLGRQQGMNVMRQLLFQGSADQRALGQISFWKSRSKTDKFLRDGIDLVIHESGRIALGRPKGRVMFSVPAWINQIISIEQPLESIIAGNKREALRRNIRKFREAGFSYRTSYTKDDFHHFYHQMYMPFVKSRHGELAAIASYELQWNLWLNRKNGRLILITQNGKTLAGMICHISGDTCHSIEGGVLDADQDLFRRGIWAYLNACVIDWGHKKAAKCFNFGGTRPWQSDPVFESKRRWGARVVSRSRQTDAWAFVAKYVKPSLQEQLNRLGLICEKDGQHYRVYISYDANLSQASDDDNILCGAKRAGLHGVLALSADLKKSRVALVGS